MSKGSRNARRERRQRKRRARTLRLALGAAAAVLAVGAGFLVLGHPDHPQIGTPDFTMVAYQGRAALGGQRIRFASLIGKGRPVVLNFWAARCPACQAEMPGFERIHHDLKRRVLILGVDVGPYTGLGTHAQARAFLSNHHISYPAAYATSPAAVRSYRVRGMPTTVIFDATGKRILEHTGYFDETQLRRALARIAAGPASATP